MFALAVAVPSVVFGVVLGRTASFTLYREGSGISMVSPDGKGCSGARGWTTLFFGRPMSVADGAYSLKCGEQLMLMDDAAVYCSCDGARRGTSAPAAHE